MKLVEEESNTGKHTKKVSLLLPSYYAYNKYFMDVAR